MDRLARCRQAVLAGRFPWKARVGYVKVEEKQGANIEPDPVRALLIARAFELMATGLYKRAEVLKTVTEEGLRTENGKPVSPQTFQA